MNRFAEQGLVGLIKHLNPRVLGTRRRLSRLRDDLLRADIARAPGFFSHQHRDTFEILRVLLENFPAPRAVEALEIGCDVRVTRYLSTWVKRIAGINLDEMRTKTDGLPKNVDVHVMDATRLSFPDESFDFVFSANVNEHIHDLSRALAEQVRVLRPDGVGYARWHPVWSGARGHHVHADMVQEWERELGVPASGYQNDGSVIEDWSHLLLSEAGMRERLSTYFTSASLVDVVVESIYTDGHINRLFFDEVEKAFAAVTGLRVLSWDTGRIDPPLHTLARLHERHGARNFSVLGCWVLFKRR